MFSNKGLVKTFFFFLFREATVHLGTFQFEHKHQSVKMEVLYRDKPVKRFKRGDPLILSLKYLEKSDDIRDMIAYNVVAMDPVSKQGVTLIDSSG